MKLYIRCTVLLLGAALVSLGGCSPNAPLQPPASTPSLQQTPEQEQSRTTQSPKSPTVQDILSDALINRIQEKHNQKLLREARKNPAKLKRALLDYKFGLPPSEEDVTVVKALLAAGADPNMRDNSSETVLHKVARSGSPGVIRALLAGKANPYLPGQLGKNAVHYVAQWGSTEMMQALIDARVDLNKLDSQGRTPLKLARTQRGSKDVIQLLESSGAQE